MFKDCIMSPLSVRTSAGLCTLHPTSYTDVVCVLSFRFSTHTILLCWVADQQVSSESVARGYIGPWTWPQRKIGIARQEACVVQVSKTERLFGYQSPWNAGMRATSSQRERGVTWNDTISHIIHQRCLCRFQVFHTHDFPDKVSSFQAEAHTGFYSTWWYRCNNCQSIDIGVGNRESGQMGLFGPFLSHNSSVGVGVVPHISGDKLAWFLPIDVIYSHVITGKFASKVDACVYHQILEQLYPFGNAAVISREDKDNLEGFGRSEENLTKRWKKRWLQNCQLNFSPKNQKLQTEGVGV